MSSAMPPLPRRIWYPWTEGVAALSARCRFRLAEAEQARIRLSLSCSGAYEALLNGAPLPPAAEPTPPWWAMHHLDLSEFVRAGDNELEIRCRHVGPRVPYLLAVVDALRGEAVERLAATDESWRLRAEAADDDRAAWAFDGVWAEPYGMPHNCPDDFLRLTHGRQITTREPLLAPAQHDAGLGEWLSPPGAGPLRARADFARGPDAPPVDWNTPAIMAHLIAEHVFRQLNAWLDQYELRCPRVVYRLPANTFGRVVLRNAGDGPVWVAAVLGESLGELERYNRRLVDYFRLAPGETRASRVSGFHYVKIVLVAGAGEIVLDPPQVQHVRYPVTQAGTFTCSHPEINRIWEAAVRTIHLCMQNEIWDGARRDYLPWMGDTHVENLCVYHALGDYDLPRRTLAVLRELGPDPIPPLEKQVYPGLVASWRNPTQPEVNGMRGYTLWWLVGLYDYWLYSGDEAFVREQLDGALAIVDQTLGRLDEQARWPTPEFTDWADLTPEENRWTNHGLALRACRCALALLETLGRQADAAKRAPRVARMAKGLTDALLAGGLIAHHPYAAAILSGGIETPAAVKLFQRYLELRQDGIASPWWRYYEMEAACTAGQYRHAISCLHKYWGPMLRIGATTFWEQFNPKWLSHPDPHAVASTNDQLVDWGYGGYRISQCHGWSAGPTAWLHRHVLGVQPSKPGFAEVIFAPYTFGLSQAAGEVPTPHGFVHVELDRHHARIALPEGVTGRHAATTETFTGKHEFNF